MAMFVEKRQVDQPHWLGSACFHADGAISPQWFKYIGPEHPVAAKGVPIAVADPDSSTLTVTVKPESKKPIRPLVLKAKTGEPGR